MNYKLCKQLKDNGFPFRTTFENELKKLMIPTPKKIIKYLDTRDYLIKFDDEWFYIPTLSELIEACMKTESKMRNNNNSHFFLEFWANEQLWSAKFWGQIGKDKFPKTAVAKLWLRLIKPNK